MSTVTILVFFVVLIWYLWPTLVFFYTHKKVKVQISDRNGETQVVTLFLDDSDPLWKAIKKQKAV